MTHSRMVPLPHLRIQAAVMTSCDIGLQSEGRKKLTGIPLILLVGELHVAVRLKSESKP